jgi:hypothetical protein
MQFRARFWELEKVSELTICYFPKIAKKLHKVLFVWYIDEGNAQIDACCQLQYPQYRQPLYLLGDEILCIFDPGKAHRGVFLIPFIERRPAYFSSHLRCRQKATYIK